MAVEIRRGSDRFLTRTKDRRTQHSFSFGEHYDPDRTGFGRLVCLDDHLLRGGTGFEEHAHSDVEIVTWVVSGALEHTDDQGRTETVRPGWVQVQSAGSGIRHREVAATGEGPTRFVQAWVTPARPGAAPAYSLTRADLVPGEASIVARLDDEAALLVARLAGGDTLRVPEAPLVHVFVATGALVRSSLAEPLSAGDAFELTDVSGVEVTAGVPTDLLIWVLG